MVFWTDLLLDSRKITSIFSEKLPNLNNVDIHEIKFHRDGPSVTLRFNLSDYPCCPPKKWAIQGFNTVQIELTLSDIQCINMNGWNSTKYNGDIILYRDEELIKLEIENNSLFLKITSKFVDVSSVSAYLCLT